MATDDCIIGAPAVLNVPPDPDEYGQVVRIVGPLPPVVVVPTQATVGTITSVPQSAVSVVLLAANAARLGATFFNRSASDFLYLKLDGSAASVLSFTVRIGPNGFYEVYPNYVGVVTGIWNVAGAGFCTATELT
jgi:hypothetical protein